MGYKVLRRKIIMSSTNLTGKPSVDRPWLQYYPEPLRKITVPECTVKEYLKMNCPGEDVAAMDFMAVRFCGVQFFRRQKLLPDLCVRSVLKKETRFRYFFLLCRSLSIFCWRQTNRSISAVQG